MATMAKYDSHILPQLKRPKIMIKPKENSKRIETDILERYQSKKAGIPLIPDKTRP